MNYIKNYYIKFIIKKIINYHYSLKYIINKHNKNKT